MTLQPDAAFLRGLDFFSSAVRQLSAEDWQLASPCQGWRALDVLGHVGQATRFGTLLLQGAQPVWSPVEPPGTVIEGSPDWRQRSPVSGWSPNQASLRANCGAESTLMA
ncbi:MAG: maleylpyruvate isomerase N-terminal domain-containing protein [Streptosporangiaceae bacterium]